MVRTTITAAAMLGGWLGPATAIWAAEEPAAQQPANRIPNAQFQMGQIGGLPDGWQLVTARPELAPTFRLVEDGGRRLLSARGGGNPDCVGYVHTAATVDLGKTYLFRVRLKISEDLNPHENLLFQCFHGSTRNGIFRFRRLADGWIEGQEKIHYPGEGQAKADVRIFFRLQAGGEARIREISLTETEPVRPRYVTVACTRGRTTLEDCRAVLDAAGKADVDLVLLPEYMQGGLKPERVSGPSFQLMAEKAREYEMYVAGGIVRIDEPAGRHYNTALLLDRQGKLVGTYDKLHPYSPELNEQGISPGKRVPVFETDFGRVGFIICYDSWFTDVVELLALKGAEVVLFPNAGYYRSLMPARAADNCVRIVASSWNSGYGVWDTVGREVLDPEADPTHKPVRGTTFRDVRQAQVGRIGVLYATLDLNCSPSPAYNGGTMYSAPGGRRNRREQQVYLDEMIRRERARWWVE